MKASLGDDGRCARSWGGIGTGEREDGAGGCRMRVLMGM